MRSKKNKVNKQTNMRSKTKRVNKKTNMRSKTKKINKKTNMRSKTKRVNNNKKKRNYSKISGGQLNTDQALIPTYQTLNPTYGTGERAVLNTGYKILERDPNEHIYETIGDETIGDKSKKNRINEYLKYGKFNFNDSYKIRGIFTRNAKKKLKKILKTVDEKEYTSQNRAVKKIINKKKKKSKEQNMSTIHTNHTHANNKHKPVKPNAEKEHLYNNITIGNINNEIPYEDPDDENIETNTNNEERKKCKEKCKEECKKRKAGAIENPNPNYSSAAENQSGVGVYHTSAQIRPKMHLPSSEKNNEEVIYDEATNGQFNQF